MSRLNRRGMGIALLGTCAASAVIAAAAPADAPPATGHKITVLPTRDAVVGRGYQEGLVAVVAVLRYDVAAERFTVVSRSAPILPQDDPDTPDVFDGIVAVNRAGGGCWRRVTPDIRTGDRVRIVQRDESGAVVARDSTVTGSVAGSAPNVVFDPDRKRSFAEVHGSSPRITLGTGQPVAGARVPLSQLEVRVVNRDGGFATNGRRALVTGVDGTLRYDSADPSDAGWTARFPIRPIDGAAVVGATSRSMWLGRDPLAGTELTVAENSAEGIEGGPRAGCDAPAEGTAEAAEPTSDPDPSAPEDLELVSPD